MVISLGGEVSCASSAPSSIFRKGVRDVVGEEDSGMSECIGMKIFTYGGVVLIPEAAEDARRNG